MVNNGLRESGALGLGQTASSEDINEGFTILNEMIAQWRVKRWLVYRLVTASWAATGATTFTIGPSGSVTTDIGGASISVRPDRLEDAYVRNTNVAAPNQPDTPLRILEAKEDYDRIALKSLTAMPSAVFYDPTLTNGTIYPWPVPNSGLYTMFVVFKVPFAAFASLATTVSFPPEYDAAIRYQLAIRLRTHFQIPPPPNDYLISLAKDAMQTIRGANTAIASLRMPSQVTRSGLYNVYSDRTY